MQDFIGRDYKVGDYLASGGAGNRKAEYGMIMYKVLEVGENLRLVRLKVSYPKQSPVIKPQKSTARNPNKYVIIDPPDNVKALFERGLDGSLTDTDAKTIGKWVHGADHQVGLF